MPDQLPDHLRELSERGEPRGAQAVFDAATADAATPAAVTPIWQSRRLQTLTAIAATVLVLGGAVAAVSIDGDKTRPASQRRDIAIATTTSTTGAPVATPTTLSESTKVYLAQTRLVPFDQCPSLANYAKQKALAVVGPYGLPGGGGIRPAMMRNDALTAGGEAAPAANDSAAPQTAPSKALPRTDSDDSFSTTNVQEKGIDEPDTVKTDGKTIFTVTFGKVFATAAGSDPKLIGTLPVEGASELLLIDKQLVVISPGYGFYATRFAQPANGVFYPGGNLNSRFTVLDVSNPAAMKVTGHLDVEGSYLSARLVDGVARLVVRSYPNLGFKYPTDGTPQAQEAAKAHNTDVVRAATTDTWLPHYKATDASGKELASKPMVTCGASYRPPDFAGFGMLSVLSFNTSNPSSTQATAVMADGEIVYGSPTRLYVATNSWGRYDAQGNTVDPSQSSLIHAFDISDPANAVYRESGRVRGTVLNQFSMSEYKGALRVATTDSNGGSESFVTILGDDGNALVPVGQVSGLGKGERIYAVRFIDDVGYVVTFRQVDPLYVLDLSDVTKPRKLGELKITGYSAYLHPIGDGLLLGVGQDASEEGRRLGVQASIFDVRNPAAPKLLARSNLGQGSSNAEFDHHAFLYWAQTKLLVLPLQTYPTCPEGSPPSCYQDGEFNGAVGLKVGDDSLTEVGRTEPPKQQQGQYAYHPGISRSVVIGNRLYLVGSAGVLQTTLDNLQQTAWVPYPYDPNQGGPPIAID